MISVFFVDPSSAVIRGLSRQCADFGVHTVQSVAAADVLVSSRASAALQAEMGEKRHLLLWTNEPRWSTTPCRSIEANGRTIHVMNCYTGDVYTDIYHYLWVTKGKLLDRLTPADLKIRRQGRPVFMMSSNHGPTEPLRINGKLVDLYPLRDELALSGYHAGHVDIYGKGWPENVAITESRENQAWADWEGRKLGIAQNYLFNIAIENTDIDNYVTEKFWHAIMARNLPIYSSEPNGITSLFGGDLLALYSSSMEPVSFCKDLSCMSDAEYLSRVNSIIGIFNAVVSDQSHLESSRRSIAQRFCERLALIVQGA